VLAAEDDAVLVSRPPSLAHLQKLQQAGLVLPEFVTFDGRDLSAHPLRERTVGALEPWGWSPAVARLLSPLGACWDPEHAGRAGKSRGTVALAALLETREDWMAEAWTIGRPCHSIEEVDEAIAAARGDDGSGDVVIKAEWGAAGRGAVRLLGEQGRTGAQERWLRRTLARQGAVVVEPWLPRLLDLSFHYDRRAGGAMKSVGVTRFETDSRGQYRGHVLGRLTDGLERSVIDLLYGGGQDPQRWRRLSAAIGAAVGGVLGGHTGPVGVDALVYRCPRDGALRMKPVVEINPRWSMGRVALGLQRRVQPGRAARLVLIGAPLLRATGIGDLGDWAAARPLQRGRGGRWTEGVLLLTEPSAVTAAVVVGEAAAALNG
jgi:hypothetical protein